MKLRNDFLRVFGLKFLISLLALLPLLMFAQPPKYTPVKMSPEKLQSLKKN